MSVLRFLSTLCLLVAVIALISDLTPTFAGAAGLSFSSVETHWKEVAPATFQSMEQSISGGRSGGLWRFAVGPLLAMPTCILFTLLAALVGYAGRRRTRVKIFAN